MRGGQLAIFVAFALMKPLLSVTFPSDLEEEIVTNCCIRQKKMKSIGISATSGEEIVLNVGSCKKHCKSNGQLKKEEFQKLLKENPHYNPKQVYLLFSSSKKHIPSCPEEDEACEPSASRIEKILTNDGLASVTLIEGCSCQKRPSSCKRTPRFVTLHKGTPLEKIVDMGDCQGHCPHGSECLTVIEDCACAASCYRASSYEHVFDYSEGKATPKVVDIGTCVGSCEAIESDLCVWRLKNGECPMSLMKRSSRCMARGTEDIVITQEDGSLRTIQTVGDCDCR